MPFMIRFSCLGIKLVKQPRLRVRSRTPDQSGDAQHFSDLPHQARHLRMFQDMGLTLIGQPNLPAKTVFRHPFRRNPTARSAKKRDRPTKSRTGRSLSAPPAARRKRPPARRPPRHGPARRNQCRYRRGNRLHPTNPFTSPPANRRKRTATTTAKGLARCTNKEQHNYTPKQTKHHL